MTDCLAVIQAEIDKLAARSRKVELDYQNDRLSSAQYHHFTGLLAGLHSAKRQIIKAQKRGDLPVNAPKSYNAPRHGKIAL
jgi:hypothetical protein